MSESAGTAFVDIDGDPSKLEESLRTSLAIVKAKLAALPEAKVEGDFSGAEAAAASAVSKIDGQIKSIPDATADGDFSHAEGAASSAASSIDGDLSSIPDVEVDDNFEEVKQSGDDAFGSITDAISGLAEKGKLGAAGAGAAAAGAFAVAFNSAMDLEKSQDSLAASLGLNEKQSQKAGEIAGDLWSNAYGDSIEDVQTTFANVYRDIGARSKPALEKATRDALNIAQTFGADTGEVTRTVGALVKNGMAKNVREAFDLITTGFQEGADKGGEFLDTLNEYAEPVKSLGLNAKDFTGILSKGLDNGVYSVDKIGDALKEFSIRVVDGSDTTSTAFGQIGLDADAMAEKFAKGGESAKGAMSETIQAIKNLHDPVAQEQAGVGLFGSMWEDVGKKVILGMDPATAALGKTKGAADDLDKTINDNLSTRLETFKRKALREVAEFMLNTVIPAVTKFVDWINSLGVSWQDVWTVVGPIIKRWAEDFTTAVKVISGLIKLVADLLHGDFSAAWDDVKGIFKAGADSVLGTLDRLLTPVKTAAKAIGSVIVGGFDAVKDIPGKLAGWMGSGLDRVTSFIDRFGDKAVRLGKQIVSGLGDGIADFASKIGDKLSAGLDRIGNAFQNFYDKASGLGGKVVGGLGSGIADFVSKIGDKLTAGIGAIGDKFQDFYDKASTLGGKVVSGLENGVKGLANTIANAVKAAITGTADIAKTIINYVLQAINDGIPNSISVPHAPDINLPDNPIPLLADGVRNFAGGLAVVGEEGPELLNLPRGADVYSKADSAGMIGRLSALEPTATDTPAIYADFYVGSERLDRRVKGHIRDAGRAADAAFRAGRVAR